MKKKDAVKEFSYISDYAKDLLDTIPEEFEIDKKEFKFLTLKELGFDKYWIETREFLNNDFLSTKGLALCNPEDVFEIAKSLNKGEYCYVGMQPIPGRGGDLKLFNVDRNDDGKSWLGNYNGGPDDGWGGNYRFVFLSRKLELSTSDTKHSLSDTLSLEQAIKICKEAGLSVTKIY